MVATINPEQFYSQDLQALGYINLKDEILLVNPQEKIKFTALYKTGFHYHLICFLKAIHLDCIYTYFTGSLVRLSDITQFLNRYQWKQLSKDDYEPEDRIKTFDLKMAYLTTCRVANKAFLAGIEKPLQRNTLLSQVGTRERVHIEHKFFEVEWNPEWTPIIFSAYLKQVAFKDREYNFYKYVKKGLRSRICKIPFTRTQKVQFHSAEKIGLDDLPHIKIEVLAPQAQAIRYKKPSRNRLTSSCLRANP